MCSLFTVQNVKFAYITAKSSIKTQFQSNKRKMAHKTRTSSLCDVNVARI